MVIRNGPTTLSRNATGTPGWIMRRFMIRSVYVTMLLKESLVSSEVSRLCCVDHVLQCTWQVLDGVVVSRVKQMNNNDLCAFRPFTFHQNQFPQGSRARGTILAVKTGCCTVRLLTDCGCGEQESPPYLCPVLVFLRREMLEPQWDHSRALPLPVMTLSQSLTVCPDHHHHHHQQPPEKLATLLPPASHPTSNIVRIASFTLIESFSPRPNFNPFKILCPFF